MTAYPASWDFGEWAHVLCGLLAGALVYLWMRREKNLPPGPAGLPLVGYLPFLGKEAYRTLHKLTDVYGPVFSLYLGRHLVVVLGNFKAVKELLTNNNVMDRPKNPPNHLLPNSTNMAISNGEVWKEQRRFTIQALRDLGMSKIAMENIIQEELQRLIKEIDSRGGLPMNLGAVLLPSVSNNILSLLIGRPFEYGDEQRRFLDGMLETMTLYFRPTRVHAYFPSVKYWFSKLKIWGYDRVEYYMNGLSKFIESQIEYHKKTLDQYNARDYIDRYLLQVFDRKDKGSTFTEKMLKGNVQSLLGAGSTPARATIEWSSIAMVLHPGVQRAVQRELDSVVGRGRLPSWSDQKKLPYTSAVLCEVMRHYSVIPISMLRTNNVRCKLGGYDIPKGTIIMTNIWGIHHDPDYWEDPDTFKPERFLKDGKVVKPPGFIPFSYGKRNCPGEDMANVEVFLYFTTLLQRYAISAPSEEESCYTSVLGIANMGIPDNVCLKIRD